MKCSLLAQGRDSLCLKEAEDDALFRKDLCETLREFNNGVATSMQAISIAMCKITECMSMSMHQLNHNFTPNQLLVPNHLVVLANLRRAYHPGHVNYQVQSPADICVYTSQSHN